MQPLIDAIRNNQLKARISVVLSDIATAPILSRAREHRIPAIFVDPTGCSREQYDRALSANLSNHQVDYVLLVGYARILSPFFTTHWRHRVFNVHPSLLPAFANKMDRAVHQAVLLSGVKETGCTVHEVTEAVDGGPIVVQKKCPVLDDDTVDTLKHRVQKLEGEALIETCMNL